VPTGYTLVIQAGTTIKFRGNYGFTVNGTIRAIGTEENPIVFTSGMPSPLEGDWGRVTLNNAPNSILRYCEFYFASDGVLVKESHHTEITHCTFDRMLLNSYGITSRNNETGTENDSNNDSLVVSYNVMRDGIQRGIHFRFAQGSRFIGNDLRVTEWGLHCYECDGSEFNENEIYPDTDGFITGGIHAQNAESSLFTGNTILGIRDYGILFNGSENSQVLSNVIADTNRQGQTTNDNNVYGIYTWDNPSNSQNIIRGNDIYLHHYDDLWGIHANYSLIDSNRIFSWTWRYRNRGIRGDYSDILNNDIVIYTQYDWDGGGRGIEAWADASDPNLIMRNTIHSIYQGRGIAANYATIEDNILVGVDDTLGYWPTHTNQQWGITDGPGLNIRNNNITGFRSGISVNGQGTLIINNEVRIWGENGFDIYQGNDAVIQKNTIVMDDGSHTYGMRLRDGIAADVFCNTVAATGNTGVGMSIENNSHPQIHSNIVYGFQTGINAVSAIYVLDFNLIYNTNTTLTGGGLPDQAGDIVTVNSNADPSDIYSNIFFNPLFNPPVNDTFQVTLQSGSPAINAGDVDSLDLDGTIADIGSWFYNFGYVPQNVQVDSTGEGFVALSWDVIETDSITGFQPYYRLSSETDWTPTFVPTIESIIVIDGLTNNTAYDFAVATLYTLSESNLSASVTTKPGVPQMVVSPRSLVAIQDVGDTTLVSYTIENTGTKDLEYVIDHILYYGTRTFTKAAYADWTLPENQDRITENVWITRQNTQGLFNAAVHSSWNCCTPYGTEWAWGSTEGNSNPYVPWRDVARYGQSGMPVYQSCSNGNVMSLHLIEQDIYFDVTWHLWTQSSGGGFSYTRTGVLGAGQYTTPRSGTVVPGGLEAFADTLIGETQGITASQIIITSNDPVTPADTINILNITGTQATLPAAHFTPVDTTSLVFYYIVESASIDGEALQTGDELALYDGDLCVGAGTYNGVLPFVIQAFGVVGSSVGFTQGDPIIVKAWDYGQSRYATIQATTNLGDAIFTAGDFATVNLTGTIYQTIEISLPGDRFNLISSYLYPQSPAISSIFGNLTNLKIVYEDNGAAYIPEYGINTIGDLDLTEGYHVFFTGDNQDLTFAGLSITPANWPITIQAQRFNSISYLYDSPMDAEVAFSAISDVIEIVQDDDGGAWIPDLGILLGNLEPGSGYQVFTNVDTDVVFTYPEYVPPITARLLASSTNLVPENFTFRKTGLPYTIVVSSVLVDRRELEKGDEIAAFDGDLCVGATVWTGETPALVTAWRHYPEAEIPGYRPGDPITFRVYKKSYTKEVEVAASFQGTDQQTFEGAVYSVAALNGNPGIIPYQFALKQNYPNPFNPVTTLAYDVAAHSEVTMVVYNLLGQEVIRLLDRHTHQPGKYTRTWKGVNASGESIGSGVYIVRMTTDGFSANRKIILLK
ncbi:MAG: right-handed parallel beta-helix repeat-containing protein, partial [Bacteroidetes bacterium]|nr:right-handed parallel beta-helix repeat-containing protein [Bacteroidota bacterium]